MHCSRILLLITSILVAAAQTSAQLAPGGSAPSRFSTPRSNDADGIEELLNRVARNGGIALLPAGEYLINRTIRVEKVGPIRIEGEGFGDRYNPERTGFRSQPTRLIWTGEDRGTLMSIRDSDGVHFSDIQLDGRGKAGRLVHVTTTPGFGCGNLRFSRVVFRSADVGIQCGESDNDPNCADIIYDEIYLIACKVGVRTVNHQSVNHHFRSLAVSHCGLALDFQRGGNVTVESWAAGTFDLLLRVGYGGPYAGTYRFTGGRPELNGLTRQWARLVEARPESSCDIVFDGTQETTGPLNERLPDNASEPIFEIGQRALLTLRNHSHIRPAVKMDGGVYRDVDGRWSYGLDEPGRFQITGGEVEIDNPRTTNGEKMPPLRKGT